MKKHITVVYGANDVPPQYVREVLRDIYEDDTTMESSIVRNEGIQDTPIEFYIVNDSDIPDDELQEVMSCLEDHMRNTTMMEDHTDHQHDLLVDEAAWVWVDVGWGRYYGPFNTEVHVYRVTI